MKRIQSDWRSSLSPTQLQRLMLVAIKGPSEDDFKAEEVVERWINSGKRDVELRLR